MSPKRMIMRRAESGGPQRPVMLAIAGDSASGKTTLTKGLAEALGHERNESMCTDDYHRYDREERASLPFTALHPSCNYLGIMEQHLQLLALGEPILKPVYNHHHGTLERPELVEPRDFHVIEGLFPLYSPLSRACFDLKVFLDPPESIRRRWKVARDTRERGYTAEQVIADLEKREDDSAAFIRPQRQWADIVVQFAPIQERHESEQGPLSATVLLRPTVPHPDLSAVLTEDTREAMHLKLARDEDGKPVDALHVHAYASRDTTRRVEESIWASLGIDDNFPDCLGTIGKGERSEPLAVVQLIILYHMLLARAAQRDQVEVGAVSP